MVAKQQEVLDKLRSGDRSTKLKAVRDIKNQIIGNKSKKLSYIKLQAVPQVVACLHDRADALLLIQSAAAVGSFAYDLEAGSLAVIASDGVKYLLYAISSQDDSVVQAALRALKLVWQVSVASITRLVTGLYPAASDVTFATAQSSKALQPDQLEPQELERLVSVLSASNSHTSGLAAQVLAEYCRRAPEVSSVTTFSVTSSSLMLCMCHAPASRL